MMNIINNGRRLSVDQLGTGGEGRRASKINLSPSFSIYPEEQRLLPTVMANEMADLLELGNGFGGTVYKSVHLPTGRVMARKSINSRLGSSKILKSVAAELSALQRAQSPYIIHFYGAYSAGSHEICLLIEYMDLGSMERLMGMKGPLPEVILQNVAYSVLMGLKYLNNHLHSMHRDLKPGNILCNREGSIKLCDFGESIEMVRGRANSLVGTTGYMAPERIMGKPYDIRSDIWSLGITLMELATGIYPYSLPRHQQSNIKPSSDRISTQTAAGTTVLELWDSISQDEVPSLSADHFTPEFRNFLSRCLEKRMDERPGPEVLLQHDFVKSRNEEIARNWFQTAPLMSPKQ